MIPLFSDFFHTDQHELLYPCLDRSQKQTKQRIKRIPSVETFREPFSLRGILCFLVDKLPILDTFPVDFCPLL